LKVTEMRSTLPGELDEVVKFSKEFVERRGGKGVGVVLDHVTINIGMIRGGVKVNVVPDLCEVELDMRLPIGLPSSRVIEFIKDVLKRYDGELEIVASSEANYTSPSCEIVKALKKVILEILGLEARPFLQIASSDARFYREKGIPTIHYGPGELETVHGYDEKIRVDDLIKASKIYAGIIAEYSIQPR
ncbi:MAG: M20/M25/M40 family metallo-hydrolase, partial [Thaumarchaeota archaeon]|nr:M20/M25/M40 family metallo-hydrolase [Nitrososphaerota archaeon]